MAVIVNCVAINYTAHSFLDGFVLEAASRAAALLSHIYTPGHHRLIVVLFILLSGVRSEDVFLTRLRKI